MRDINEIKKFMLGLIPNNEGKFITDIWFYDSFEMENKHTYIQWMFPIDTQSQFNEDCPIISYADAQLLGQDDMIKLSLKASLSKFMLFLTENNHWIKKNNHNLLRITRVLRCMFLFGMTNEYNKLRGFCIGLYKIYNEKLEDSYPFWMNTNKIS